MEKAKLELITNRLKAINRISHILDQKESTEWDFSALCKIFVETIGYTSCWIALTDDRGGLRYFTRHQSAGSVTARGEGLDQSAFGEFVKETLVQRGDYSLDRDPLLDHLCVARTASGEGAHSVTMKLIHNNIIYGIMSVTLTGDHDFLKEEVLIISELVKTISFFLYDIDSKNKMQDLLLTMFETTGTGVILIEEDTTIAYANREFELLCGYDRKDIVGAMSFTDFVLEEDRPRLMEYHRLRRIAPERAPRNYEFRFVDRNGGRKIIFMTIDMVPRTRMSLASFMNVTEKKKLESEVLRVSEQERQNIGNELHDGLGPHLVGIRMMLKLVRGKIDRAEVPSASEIDEIDELITAAIDQTRTLIKGLKPVDIQPDGLAYAIEELTSRTGSRYGVECTFDHDPGFSIGDNITATHLYYIVREAVNNALKHSGAKSIRVVLSADRKELTAEISDDGIGPANLLDSTQGMGISIMKYRASIINATLEFRKNEPAGTSVLCRLPG